MERPKSGTGAAAWRLLCDEAADAAWNMAADEAMLLSHAAGQTPPTLRFYTWNPAAVSLGYFQQADAEIDRDICARQGIDVVRRLTGGRAVLHEAEVTYSLVVSANEPYIPASVTASYLFFSRGIVAGLARMGIDAQMHNPGSEGEGMSGRKSYSAACFDAPSHYEITVGGRKVVGSAQVRQDGVLLQHGSILLHFCPERLAGLMRFGDEASRAAITAELSQRATGLSETAGRQVGYAEVVAAVEAGIGKQCGIELRRGKWMPAEIAMIRELSARKYGNMDWNLRR